jgi:predicted dehydrogenase
MVDGRPKRQIYPTIDPPTYVGFYRDMAAALEGKRAVPVAAEEARDVLRIVEAAIQSSKEDRTIVL